MSAADRFAAMTIRRGPVPIHSKDLGRCHVWTGAKDRAGYGIFQLATRRTVKAHRFALSVATGKPIRSLRSLRHLCGNASCVRGSHLREGTNAENARDRDLHGRTARHERNGRAIINMSIANAIRAAHARGDSYRTIAASHGLGRTQIGRIVRCEQWVQS